MSSYYEWFFTFNDREYKFWHCEELIEEERLRQAVLASTHPDHPGCAILALTEEFDLQWKTLQLRGKKYYAVPVECLQSFSVKSRHKLAERLVLSDAIKGSCDEQ